MKNSYVVVMTTTSCQEDADQLARGLLTQKLAACIQVTPIQSYYRWQDSINIDHECLLLIKCQQVHFCQIQQYILANHHYEVPEIIQIPITDGLPAYFQWINDVTQATDPTP